MTEQQGLVKINTSLELTGRELQEQINSFQQVGNVIKKILEEGTDYGIIPYCGSKRTMFKSGAEKLARFFKFSIEFKHDKSEVPGFPGHVEYEFDGYAKLFGTDTIIGQGTGSCTTLESKYRYRKKDRVCPLCNKETIIDGKKEYGGGFVCYKKKGGCGQKFKENDQTIISQKIEHIEHENPADYRNTVRKMAKKRCHIDTVITTLGVEMTQDIEQMVENAFQYNEANNEGDDSEFGKIKEALERQNIDRQQFIKWIRVNYGSDSDSMTIIQEYSDRIIDTIMNKPQDIIWAANQWKK
jgi:hypothetical protein